MRESVQTVDALTPSALRAVLPALRAAREELRTDLQTWLSTVDNDAERFSAYQKMQALRALEASFERIQELEPAMGGALAGVRHAVGPLAIANLDHEIQRLSAIFGGGIPTIPQIQAAAIIAKGDKLLWKRHASSARRYAGAVGDDIHNMLQVGVAKGETFDQLVTRLRRLGNRGATAHKIDPGADGADIANGLFGRHRWWAERLVRTEGMNAYNVEHDESIRYANEHRPEGDEEFLRRWDAAADYRTCILCAALDGTITTINGTFKGGIDNPPLHPCCRCIVLAWMRRWGDMKGEIAPRGPMPPEQPRRKVESSPPPPPKRAKAPPKPYKIPTLAPVTPLPTEAQRVLNLLQREDYGGAVHHLGEVLKRRGLVESTVANTADVSVTDEGMRMLNHSGQQIDARAYRNWNGSIRLSPGVADEIQRFATAAGGMHAGELQAALEAHAQALFELRGKAPKHRKAEIPKGDESWVRLSSLQGNGVKTVVHETLHGFSPLEATAYRGAAGQIEEVTTEVMARVVSEDLFGIKIASWNSGSYAQDITAVTEAIAELTGKSKIEAYADLQEASARFKTRTQKYTQPHEVTKAFAEDVQAVIFNGQTQTAERRWAIDDAIDKHLMRAAKK